MDAVIATFDSNGAGGRDMFYLLRTLLTEGKMRFPQFISDAAKGHGCTVHEGLSYSLDRDWDSPENFDEVKFFVGDLESSALKIDDFIFLLQTACTAYLAKNPGDHDFVTGNMMHLIKRYRAEC